MFFSNLEMKNQNWTFINVLFSKIQNRFEKILHHHFFSVRTPHFRGLTFMVWRRANRLPQMTALCSGSWGLQYRRTDGPTDGGAVWWNSWIIGFGGCFEKGRGSRKE
jgi:hypothetical protein